MPLFTQQMRPCASGYCIPTMAATSLTSCSAPANADYDSESNKTAEQRPGGGACQLQRPPQEHHLSLAALDRALRLAAGTWLQQLVLGQEGLGLLLSPSSAHSLLQQLPLQQQLPLLTTLLQAVGYSAAWEADAGTTNCSR
jgi:hypothetical protein